MTLVELGLAFFVLVGSKILLGAVVVFMLLPQELQCAVCDTELLPILPHPGARPLMRWIRLERRWCARCRRETLARARRSAPPPVLVAGPVAESRVR